MWKLEGNCAVLPPILSREEAAKKLGVKPRTLQNYLNTVRVFKEEFANFTHPLTGNLNPKTKLTEWHIELLEKVRDRINEVGVAQTEIELKRGDL